MARDKVAKLATARGVDYKAASWIMTRFEQEMTNHNWFWSRVKKVDRVSFVMDDNHRGGSIMKMEEHIQELRTALEFYRDEWRRDDPEWGAEPSEQLMSDEGDIARRALAIGKGRED
jgi:hypothetical protein